MSAGLSRIFPNRIEERRTLNGAVYPSTPVGGYDLTQANFPSLKHAFTPAGITGNNLVDVLTGAVTIINTAGWNTAESGGVGFRRNTGTLSGSGAWTAIGNKNALLIAVGNFTGLAGSRLVSFGDALVGTELGIFAAVDNTDIVCVRTGTDYVSSAGVSPNTTPAWLGAAALLNQAPANGAYTSFVYQSGGTKTIVPAVAIAGDISANWPAFSLAGSGNALAVIVATAGLYYTGIYLLIFDSFLPPNALILDALTWMSVNPYKLYPGFYKIA